MGKRGPPARVVPDWIWEYAKLHTVGQSQPLKIALINKLLRWSKRGPSQYKRGPRWSKPTQGWSSAPPAKPPAPSRTMVCRCYSGGMRVACHGMWVVGHRTAVVAKQHNQQPTNHEGTSRPLHGRRWPMPTADVCTFPILQIHSGLSCAQIHEGLGSLSCRCLSFCAERWLHILVRAVDPNRLSTIATEAVSALRALARARSARAFESSGATESAGRQPWSFSDLDGCARIGASGDFR